MLNDKYIEKLKTVYKIPEAELEEMGLIKTKTELLCCRVTKKEYEKFQNYCSNQPSTMSDILRTNLDVDNLMENIDITKVKKLKKRKITKSNTEHISLRIRGKDYEEIKDYCKKNKISVANLLRYLVKILGDLEGGKT